MSDHYVLLTGAKNNAGDFLIVSRARALLAHMRPDRELKELPRWKPFSDDDLQLANSARALLLVGGPGVRRNMRPELYPMAESLRTIKVPIVTMGLGWKSTDVNWEGVRKYSFNEDTLELLSRIDNSGYLSSVRDYRTLHVLLRYGFRSFVMTGCPALFQTDKNRDRRRADGNQSDHVAFSVGANFAKDADVDEQTRELILRLRDRNAKRLPVVVYFHHSLDESYLGTHGANVRLFEAQQRLSTWLAHEGVHFADVSGDEAELIERYQRAAIHVGYRVHAHILMSSMNKSSILIAEDGRGAALREVLGGYVFPAYGSPIGSDVAPSVLRRLTDAVRGRQLPRSAAASPEDLWKDVEAALDYDSKHGQPAVQETTSRVAERLRVMSAFLRQLP